MEKAEDVWILAKEHDPAVCLLIVDSTEERVEEGAGQVSRTEIVSWCLKHNFELIESDEVSVLSILDVFSFLITILFPYIYLLVIYYTSQ